MAQKYNKFENSGHPMQNQFRQQGGYSKFGQQQQQQQQLAYAQMMNQMSMMQFPQQSYPQFPQTNYPMPQQFPGQSYPNRFQGQYNPKPQNLGPTSNLRPAYPLSPQIPPPQLPVLKTEKVPFICNSVEDLNANRAAFGVLKTEEKQMVYKRLILQKLKYIPDIVKEFDN